MSSTQLPWHAMYPVPRSVAPFLSRQELLQWFQAGKQTGKDFVLVDLRRTDFEGGTIRGSLNLPAQSLYLAIPTIYYLLVNSKVEHVIWYCGSSRGRGTRAACWFADYLEAQQETTLKSLVLEGGIKGWATAGPEYTEFMDEYDASAWMK
ncbi:putative arsenate reductase (Arc2) [Aspergillus tanneri]|uniref:Rhodanese domain-containing protein n=1 Tax=Aspergillus tanneri TaxID=1220188 RepID=A0A5M9MVK6_9EURO|nr:uncharacterized protein ATNIH1004_005271 [Aspergillus tanneri]KAA8649370.1 hypothetical protein ATNIH1004_005271 [Aspergillus tanneri]